MDRRVETRSSLIGRAAWLERLGASAPSRRRSTRPTRRDAPILPADPTADRNPPRCRTALLLRASPQALSYRRARTAAPLGFRPRVAFERPQGSERSLPY